MSQASYRKVVLVTGAARRLGRAIALAFAKSGWDVALHYATSRDDALATVELIAKFGAQAVALNRDLSIEAGVETLVPEVVAQLGRIDCVVNNAVVCEPDEVKRFNRQTLAQHMNVNVAAAVALARALYEFTPDPEQSCVINLLDHKLDKLDPELFSYTLSKAALEAATSMLAQTLAPRVRVVGVAPGSTLKRAHETSERFESQQKEAALGYGSTPDDICEAVLFAAQCKALTGTTLVVDSGQHLPAWQPRASFGDDPVATDA